MFQPALVIGESFFKITDQLIDGQAFKLLSSACPWMALFSEYRLEVFNRIRHLSAVCAFPRPLTLAAAVKPLWRAGLPSPQRGEGLRI